jgi:hypothetical protein
MAEMMAEPSLSDAQLKFLRDEILKIVVTSIATAKAEALAEADARTQAAKDIMARSIALTSAASNMAAVEASCAIVSALAERGGLDPARVVAWAQWMAENQPAGTEPTVSDGAANTLRTFAKLLSAMASQRPDGPSARN